MLSYILAGLQTQDCGLITDLGLTLTIHFYIVLQFYCKDVYLSNLYIYKYTDFAPSQQCWNTFYAKLFTEHIGCIFPAAKKHILSWSH